jgi:hypothetical protein
MTLRSFASLLALFATACTTVAPSQGYRSSGSTEAPWEISGELFDFTNVKILINGTKVIDERLSLLSGDGEFRSSYRGKRITASLFHQHRISQFFHKVLRVRGERKSGYAELLGWCSTSIHIA